MSGATKRPDADAMRAGLGVSIGWAGAASECERTEATQGAGSTRHASQVSDDAATTARKEKLEDCTSWADVAGLLGSAGAAGGRSDATQQAQDVFAPARPLAEQANQAAGNGGQDRGPTERQSASSVVAGDAGAEAAQQSRRGRRGAAKRRREELLEAHYAQINEALLDQQQPLGYGRVLPKGVTERRAVPVPALARPEGHEEALAPPGAKRSMHASYEDQRRRAGQ